MKKVNQKEKLSISLDLQIVESKLIEKYPELIESVSIKRNCKKTINVQLKDNNFTNLQKTINVNGNRFAISQDIFVGKVDSICCFATNGNLKFAITTAHSFTINKNGWFPRSSYKTDKGYVVYYNSYIDLAIIELDISIAIHSFNGNTMNFVDDGNNHIFYIGENRIHADFKEIGQYRNVSNCLKYQYGIGTTEYGSSGSYVCLNGKLIGMHLGKNARLLGGALPINIIKNELRTQKFILI